MLGATAMTARHPRKGPDKSGRRMRSRHARSVATGGMTMATSKGSFKPPSPLIMLGMMDQ
jgi:hypothetical protein